MTNKTILTQIDDFLEKLYKDLENGKLDEIELIEQLRRAENNESIILFYFFIERFLWLGLKNKQIFVSKAVFKYYLQSKYKEHEDNLFYGNVSGSDVERVDGSILVRKKLFIKILDLLNLEKTKKLYIDYLFSIDEEFKNYGLKSIMIEDVIEQLFEEIDEKNLNGKIIRF